MTLSRKVPAFVVLLGLSLASTSVRADGASELERAKSSYDAGRYAEGAERFRDMLDPESPRALRNEELEERARAYYAACLIALGRSDEANVQIEKVIRKNGVYSPDPVIFPGKVIDRFIEVKGRLKTEIEKAAREKADIERAHRNKAEKEQRAYIEGLQRLAGEETITVRHSRWIAALPFGAGQFQNGQPALGYAFLVSEALLAAASVTAGSIHMQIVADYASNATTSDFADFESRRRATQDVSLFCSAAFAVMAVGGVVQAQLAFVPEVKETRQRPIPKPPTLTPTISALPTGATLGLTGTF
ncbi:MAG TPA: hypothetical protein VJT73_10890 [Polyangiaceae bacterium]|nr:hypothetical protein [Polyangiaceae bacterium]